MQKIHIFQAEEISAFNRKYCSLHWTKKRKLEMSKCLRLKQVSCTFKGINIQFNLLSQTLIHLKVHSCMFRNGHIVGINMSWCLPQNFLTLFNTERPKLYAILAILSAVGLRGDAIPLCDNPVKASC